MSDGITDAVFLRNVAARGSVSHLEDLDRLCRIADNLETQAEQISRLCGRIEELERAARKANEELSAVLVSF
jgi:hypothetical protein